MISKKNILIIGAHLDDIEIGTGGLALRYINEGYCVFGLVVCKGNTPNRLTDAKSIRGDVFIQNMTEMGFTEWRCLGCDDQNIAMSNYNDLVYQIQKYIEKWQIDTIYTNNNNDINVDHRMVSEITRVAARPRSISNINKLFEYHIPGSTDWNFTTHNSSFNVAVNITDYFADKLRYIGRYVSEIREGHDPLSLDKLTSLAEYHGSIFGFDKAEVFKLIFSRED